MFLPEGLAPTFPLAALLIRPGLLLDANLIGLQNGLIQGLAAGLILAKLQIGVPEDDGAVRLGDDMGGDPLAVRPPIIPFLRDDDSSRCLRLKCKLLPKKSPSNTGTPPHASIIRMVPYYRAAYATVSTNHT